MAASRKIGGIYAELSLKDARFRRGLKNAGRQLTQFGGMALKTGAVAVGAMAAGLAVGTKKTIAMGAELDHMSSQTGVAVGSLIKIGQAYKDAGKGAETAGKDINKMQRAIYEASQAPGTTLDYFADLGLSAAKLMEMSPEDQFFTIGRALKEVENQTKQSAVAMDIFGRSGGELLTVFKGSTLEDVNASLGRMPEIMEEFSGAMERADTLMGRLPNKSDQFFTGFTSGIIGQLLPGLEAVNNKDFTTLGENLGDALATALQSITDGTAWEIFKLHGEKAMLQLQQSDELSAFASTFNALFDEDYLGGYSTFNDAFDKYAEAGINANQEELDRINAEIAKLITQSKERAATRKDAASGIGNPVADFGTFMSQPPDWMKNDFYRDPYDIEADADIEDTEKDAGFMQTRAEVNAMQARGLSFGATYRDNETKEVKSLLTSIRDALERAETGGVLTWA